MENRNQQNLNQNQNNNNQQERFNLTPQTVGIAANRKNDLVGHVLSPKEIAESVITMFSKVGVSPNEVHSVRITKEKDELEIAVVVEEDAVRDNGGSRSMNSWIGAGNTNKFRIKPAIYNALRNKAFEGNLHYQREKIKGDHYIVMNLDAEIVLSFIYDAPYHDMYLRVAPIQWNTSKKNRKKLGYQPYGAVITWRPVEGKFNPKAVEEFNDKGRDYSDDDDDDEE